MEGFYLACLKGLSVIVQFHFFSETPDLSSYSFHFEHISKQQFSRKQHYFGKRDNS